MLLVGGGSVLVDTKNWIFKGVSSIKRTPHFDVRISAVQCKLSKLYKLIQLALYNY